MGEGQADRQRAGLWWEWREMRGTHLFPGGHPGRLPGESGLRRRSEVGACPLNLASFAFGRCYPFTAKLSKTALWGFLAYFFSLAFFFFFFFQTTHMPHRAGWCPLVFRLGPSVLAAGLSHFRKLRGGSAA